MNRLLALEIESNPHSENRGQCLFDSHQTEAYLSGLGVVYEEAFIISTPHHIAAWVVGEHQGLLINSFQKYDEPLCRVNLFLNNDSARLLFFQTVSGDRWEEFNRQQKYHMLMRSRDLAVSNDCLGPVISELITRCSQELNTNSFLNDNDESWSLGKGVSLVDKIEDKSNVILQYPAQRAS